MSRLIKLTVIWLALACASAWGAPSISGVSGTVADGQSITVSGSDFGNGPSVVIFDDFEKGTNGSTIATGDSSAQVSGWTSVLGIEHDPIYSNANSVSGSLALRANMDGHWICNVWKTLPANTNIVFLSFWQLIPVGTNWPYESINGVNFKCFYFGVDAGAVDDHTYLHQYLGSAGSSVPASLTVAGHPDVDQSGHPRYASNWNADTGEWKRFWYYAEAPASASGIVQAWEIVDSGVAQILSINDYTGFQSSGKYFNHFSLNYFGRSASNCYPTYDDVYLAVGNNARARVEIGNNATYANCTNLAICTPTSWGSSSITATVRQGSFSAGTAYLFVVDADGVASSGYQITLGGDNEPPAPPSGISVWQVSGTVSIH